ncbi:ATP-binding cassette domain-containing protein (plasmid) [Sphingomonadaceae bacterium OTU29MARTA1]|nr:ATP-binding cassette domain-containing protein [Sphingomonadaceae bacterium OTU29MARTA1]
MADGLHVSIHQAGPIPLAVDLTVAPNETLALIGPSGAGKTTILRTIAGLYPARQGRIVANGHVWFDDSARIDVPARQRRVGVVFQSYALFPHLTAIGNVMEAMVDHPRAERQRAAVEMLARVHLDGLGDRRPELLSGGQQQRVALARALARDPDVLLFDEPFSAVDRPTRRALHRLIAELRAVTPVPIVFVTHDIEDVAASADRVCFLREGSLIETRRSVEIHNGGNSPLERWLAG